MEMTMTIKFLHYQLARSRTWTGASHTWIILRVVLCRLPQSPRMHLLRGSSDRVPSTDLMCCEVPDLRRNDIPYPSLARGKFVLPFIHSSSNPSIRRGSTVGRFAGTSLNANTQTAEVLSGTLDTFDQSRGRDTVCSDSKAKNAPLH